MPPLNSKLCPDLFPAESTISCSQVPSCRPHAHNSIKTANMLCMKSVAFLAALVFSATCYSQSAAGSVGPEKPVQDVSLCQLSKAPSEFAGKTIRIRGVYRYALEMSEFEPAQCCPEKMRDRFRVSINGNPMYPDAHSQRLVRKLTSQMNATALVVFVGTLNGHVLNVERVERIEKLSHPKDRDHEPSWASQNCEQSHALGQ